MKAGRIHVVGAGVAGLSAAIAATKDGGEVVVYEAAPQPGGRCRTIRPADGFAHDNGTHVLFTGNTGALRFLTTIGARDRWFEPEPSGLPVYDAPADLMRFIGLNPLSWLRESRRPYGMTLRSFARIVRLAFSSTDRPVAAIVGDCPVMHSLVEPLTTAMLNTPAAQASSKRLARALRRLGRPGAAHLLVARNGLSEDLIEPAAATLVARGGSVRAGQRLQGLMTKDARVTGLALTDRTVMLAPEDRVVLALPPGEIRRLLPMLPVPTTHQPILNVHFRIHGFDIPRFVGLTGTLAQWALVRRDHVSVTVSAAEDVIDRSSAEIAARVWREIAPALARLGLDTATDLEPESRIVKEKRATIRQAAEAQPQPPLLPFSNLALAGDWIGFLPASIESAVLSGDRAASALRIVRHTREGVRSERLSNTEDAA
jgi:uncharacterized protein with NAD-binding domain and iron-sulfur cluster